MIKPDGNSKYYYLSICPKCDYPIISRGLTKEETAVAPKGFNVLQHTNRHSGRRIVIKDCRCEKPYPVGITIRISKEKALKYIGSSINNLDK